VSALKLYLLGAPRLKHGREAVRLPRQKSLALLIYLAVTAREHARQKLAALLWPDFSEAQARQALRTALADIRRTLGDGHLIADAETVSLNPTGLWLDTQQTDAHTGASENRPGPFLEGFNLKDAPDFDDWAAFERDRWLQATVKKLRGQADAQEAQGQLPRALETTRQLLALDPLQEAAHRQQMRLHYALGDRTAALQHYETTRDLLARELSVEPMAETRALYQQILAANSPAPALGRTGLKPAPANANPPPAPEAALPFIGRTAERTALTRAWETARSGQVQFVFVDGEAGVGKTRLLQETAAGWAGARVLVGTSHPLDINQPYHPIIDVLRDYARDLAELPALPGVSDDWLSELTRLAPELREKRLALHSALRVPTVPERSGLIEAEQERNRLFEAVSRFLQGLAQLQPVVLLLDDTHWADPSTLALLAYLAHALQRARLLVVCTYRGAEITPALERLLQALSREGPLTRLSLRRLEPGEVAALAQAVTCQASLSFAAWLYHESEGNPYFIREIVAYLLEAGLVQRGVDGWQTDLQQWTATLPAAPLPASIQDLIRARLQRTSETARQLLDVAAIVGRDFDFATLERASGQAADPSLDALDELLHAQLVRQTSKAAAPYEFTHIKIRDVILKEMSLARQQILHRRVGEALEVTQRERLPELAGALAEHFRACGDGPKAARYARIAGDHARAVLALPEAVAFYSAALEARAHLSEPEAARLYAAQGEAYRALGQSARSVESFAQALALWEKSGDRERMAAMHFEMGNSYLFLNSAQQAHAHAQAGLRALDGLARPDERLVAQGQVLWGNALSIEGKDFAEARAHLQQGVASFTRAGDLAGLVQAHFTLGNVAAQEGALEQAVGYFEQTVDDAVRANDTVMEALACNNAAHHHLLLGHVETAHALAQRGLALAEGHTLYSVLVYLYGTLGDIRASEQQWDQAEAWLQKGLALAEQLNSAERRADYLAKLAEVAYGREQYPLAVEHLQAATRLADEQGARYASAQYHLRLAALLAEQGAAAEAKPHLQRGRQIAREGHYGRLLKQASKTR
jgi:DNA-binding SARP family transcriptional activator